jgi:molybdopterin converting factor small subunit
MVKVTIKILGSLKELATHEEILEIPEGSDISRLLQKLINKHGSDLRNALLDPILESPIPSNLILINGIEINNLDGLRTPINDGDNIILLSVIHGG